MDAAKALVQTRIEKHLNKLLQSRAFFFFSFYEVPKWQYKMS